jgi:hypothetical protein
LWSWNDFCVNHKILLSKLEFHSIKGKAMWWCDSYFRNSYQRVLITNNDLNQHDFFTREGMKHGVLQRLTLVLLLLPLCINDLPRTINDKTIPILFADYTSIPVTSPNKNDFQINIHAALNCINEWLNVNLLYTNFNKTYILFTTTNKPKTNIKIAYDWQITIIPIIKFLGIYINNTINWKYNLHTFFQNWVQFAT